MRYYIEGKFKGLVQETKYSPKNEKEYTFNYIVLESEQNITLIKKVQYNAEKFDIDENEMNGKSVLLPVFIDNVNRDGKVFENIRLIGEPREVNHDNDWL